MLSLKYTDNSHIVAIQKYKKTQQNRFVYYDPNATDIKHIKAEEITDDILQSYYGESRVRYNVDKDKKREELHKILQDEYIRSVQEFSIKDNSQYLPFPMLFPQGREYIRLCGKSGSGKSHLALHYIRMYRGLKYKNMFVISPIEDPKYKREGATFINIDDLVKENENSIYKEKMNYYKKMKLEFKYKKQKLLKEKPLDVVIEAERKIDELKPEKDLIEKGFKLNVEFFKKLTAEPNLFILDDYEGFKKKNKKKKAYFLLEILATTGRHTVSSVLDITHKISDGMNTRTIMNEVTTHIIYKTITPKSFNFITETVLSLDSSTRKRFKKTLHSLPLFGYLAINVDNNFVVSTKKIFLY